MELARKQQRRAGAGGLTVHVNKVDHVTTIDRVAAQLGESVDFLHDVANEMDIEDGVTGSRESATMAFWHSQTSASKISWSSSKCTRDEVARQTLT